MPLQIKMISIPLNVDVTFTNLGINGVVRRMYHGCGGSTEKCNEGKDGNLANKCGHGFKHQHAIHVWMLQNTKKLGVRLVHVTSLESKDL